MSEENISGISKITVKGFKSIAKEQPIPWLKTGAPSESHRQLFTYLSH